MRIENGLCWKGKEGGGSVMQNLEWLSLPSSPMNVLILNLSNSTQIFLA
jgi:hypothetical protein